MTTEHTRRGILAASAGIVSAGLAGCVGSGGSAGSAGSGSGSGKLNVQASFFVVGDFTAQVAGDVASANTVVPIGQHGHGWEPGPDIQRDVLTADAFVYVMKGFQPWADDVLANARTDDADVAAVEAAAGISLISAENHDEHGDPGENDENDENDTHEGNESGGHGDAHGSNESENHSNEHEKHGNESGGGGDADHAQDANHEKANESEHEANESEHGTNGSEHGSNGSDDHEQGDGHAHDEGGTDPHFWLDPRRAKRAVENIRVGLTRADPGNNAAAYRENADAYATRLDDLDRRFADRLETAPKDHVLVAGHDAFGYLGERYGFTVHSLTGLAPDDQPTPQDVAGAQEIVDAYDIEYVLAPQLESKRAATRLVAETSAREVLEVTPLPSIADAWEQKNWGYVEIMENVNLPAFAKALGTE